MEVVGIDLFQHGSHHYLVIVDQFSGYIYVQRLASRAAPRTMNPYNKSGGKGHVASSVVQ